MAQYIYGKNMVASLLDDRRPISRLYVLSGRPDDPLADRARRQGIEVVTAGRDQLDKLAAGSHQGYVAETADFRLYSLDEIRAAIPEGKLPLLIALDSLEDPHNLGAIMRTAECVGADGIIIEKDRSVTLNATVAKVSAGAIDSVKVTAVTNLAATLRQLKEHGYWVCGTAAEGSQDYRQARYDMPLVLVIGSEGRGMRRLIRDNCDFTVRLPMFGTVGSLNASVACGIILYAIYDRRYPLEKGQ